MKCLSDQTGSESHTPTHTHTLAHKHKRQTHVHTRPCARMHTDRRRERERVLRPTRKPTLQPVGLSLLANRCGSTRLVIPSTEHHDPKGSEHKNTTRQHLSVHTSPLSHPCQHSVESVWSVSPTTDPPPPSSPCAVSGSGKARTSPNLSIQLYTPRLPHHTHTHTHTHTKTFSYSSS